MIAIGSAPGDGPKNRYFPRINAEVLLAYRPSGAPADESQVVKSRSIDLGGLMFEADHPLPVGSLFHLDLVLGELRLEVKARVIYTRKVKNDNYQIGFSFTNLSEDHREQLLNFFLQEYDRLPPEGP